MHWHILGAGAIGRLFACKLARAGFQPVLVYRDTPAGESLQQLLLDGDQETRFSLPCTSIEALPPGQIEGLIISTKANQAAAAFEAVAGRLADKAPVLLLHNGMGVYEQIHDQYPQLDLYCGTTTEGAYLEDDGHLVHAGHGDTLIGRHGRSEAPAWFEPFSNSGEGFSWEADIDASLWRKLLINCAINPLTAVHRCRNGDILANPAWRAEAELLCEELAAVSAARGNEKGATCALDWALAVMQSTANNQSSMLQDVLNYRQTEIEYITGYFCAEARRLDIPCPRNEKLLREVRQLDSARTQP